MNVFMFMGTFFRNIFLNQACNFWPDHIFKKLLARLESVYSLIWGVHQI